MSIAEQGKRSGFQDWQWTRYESKDLLLEAMEECEREGRRYTLDFEVLNLPSSEAVYRKRGIWPFRWTSVELVRVYKPTRVWGLTVEREAP